MNNWYRINEITAGIFSIDESGDNTIYLICGDEKALLIDTGWGIANLKKTIRKITKLPLIVVNTHGHPDHVSGDYQFNNIHIGEKDKPILEGCFCIDNRKWALNNVKRGPYPSDFNAEKWINSNVDDIIPVYSGFTFDLGNKIVEVIELPGHTPGGIGLLDRESRMLFSGDSIMLGHIWLHLDHSTSIQTYYEGLIELNRISNHFDVILPAHGPSFKTEMLNKFISASLSIIKGEVKGVKHNTFVGEGLITDFNDFSIVYDPLKVL